MITPASFRPTITSDIESEKDSKLSQSHSTVGPIMMRRFWLKSFLILGGLESDYSNFLKSQTHFEHCKKIDLKGFLPHPNRKKPDYFTPSNHDTYKNAMTVAITECKGKMLYLRINFIKSSLGFLVHFV